MKRIILVLTFISLCQFSFANITGSYLKIGIPARSVAMGDAFTSVSGDVNSLFINPSGIGNMELCSAFLSRNIWFENIVQNSLGYAQNFKFGTLGFSIITMDYGSDIPGYDEFGNYTKNYSANNMNCNLIYSNSIKKILYGIRYKYINEELADESSSTSLLDIGLIFDYSENFKIGFELDNIGQNIKFIEEEDEFPRVLKVGFSYSYNFNELHSLMISFDILQDEFDNIKQNIGIEYSFKNNYFGRIGYKNNYDLSNLTLGLGVKLPLKGLFDISVDYAYQDMDILGDTHRISLIFSKKEKKEKVVEKEVEPEPPKTEEEKFEQVKEIVKEEKEIEVTRKKGDIVIKIFSINFETNKFDISKDKIDELDKLYKVIKLYPERDILIEGHADNIYTKQYNQTLSEKRVESVMNFLIEKGIKKERIIIKGYGETKPIASNDTEQGRAKNRRVEVTLIKK